MPKRLTKNEFILKAKLIHGDKYDYSQVIYVSNKEKIIIICPKHNLFEQKPHNHLKGYGCLKCGLSIKSRINITDFIVRSNITHNNKYNYSLVNFTNTNDKIEIICPTHGIFKQVVYGHLSGRGCSKCNQSKGEKLISYFLNTHKIKYYTQHKFINCFNPTTNKLLPFDFYLPDTNICIEFDGRQHYI